MVSGLTFKAFIHVNLLLYMYMVYFCIWKAGGMTLYIVVVVQLLSCV